MAKKLQISLNDAEYEEIVDLARSRDMSVAQWISEALRSARERDSERDRKLQVIRTAAKHNFPAPDIEEMLDEIERGCRP